MSTASSAKSSRDVSKAHGCMLSQDDYLAKLATEDSSSHVSSLRSQSPRASNAQDQSRQWTLHDKPTPISDVLQYVKRTFDDETALDSLPLEAAGNTGAWKAWRAFRRSNNQNNGLSAPETGLNTHVEWSWDGVWEERVRKGIDASTAESTLYGSMAGDDLVSFQRLRCSSSC